MKKCDNNESIKHDADLRLEYKFDYATAKPNRFAGRARLQPVVVALAPDVAKVFKDEESVNAEGMQSIVKVESLDIEIPATELYAGIDFPTN